MRTVHASCRIALGRVVRLLSGEVEMSTRLEDA